MYRRFLCDSDYLSLLTKEALSQLVREVPDRIWQAEEASEASILEYLHGKYEIEKALEVGKIIKDYNPQITYPAGAHFLIDNHPYRALRTIQGNKRPSSVIYWEEVLDTDIEMMTPEEEDEFAKAIEDSFQPQEEEEALIRPYSLRIPTQFFPDLPFCRGSKKARKYSQRKDYLAGEYVKFAEKYYRCLAPNGPSYNDIQVPSVTGWEEVEVVDWEIFVEYTVNQVVAYEGYFYALLTLDGYDTSVNPKEADDSIWGQIADYDPNERYEFVDTEWVVCDDKVWIPTMDPNATVLEEGVNYAKHDPRNINLKKHLLRMAVYELHKLIAPHNISTARITDYEASLQWLKDAARFAIDPGIRRCIDHTTHKPVTDYGIATFRRDYDPYQNEWQI